MKLFIIVLVGTLLVESAIGFINVHVGKKRSEPELDKLIDVVFGKREAVDGQLKDPKLAKELEEAIVLAKDLKPKIQELVAKEKAKYGIA